MKCPTCGNEIPVNTRFCTVCGTAAASITPDSPVSPAPAAPVTPAPQPKLLGPWAYFGLQLLFSIPVVGFILLIVFSFDNSNLNRRNFARSYWCALIVGFAVFLVLLILLGVTGAGQALISELSYY